MPLLTACAKIAPPPGGPPDAVAPVLLATRPESLGVYPGFTGNAEFLFDETVSEGNQANLGYGTGDLERLVILSPSDKVPKIGWERSRITVRPREGWRPNTIYRIELLPGVTDLRRNRDKAGQVLTFSTGAPLPTDTLRGVLIDWSTRQRARQVTVEAVLLPDSLIYRTQTDSLGRFTLAPMPHGAYLLRGYADQNKNRRLDGRETWDTVAAAPAPAADAVLWIAERDTFPPRLQAVTPRDSQTVDVQLSQPYDPAQAIDTSNVRLRLLPDSTPVAVLSFLPRTLDDTLMARARALADSLRADSVRRARPDSGARPPVDSTKRPPPPAPPAVAGGTGRPGRAPAVDSALIALLATRPSLSDRLVLRVGAPLPPESKYVLEIDGIRNITGASGHALIGFAIPKRAPPPKARVDSLRPDSAAHDSTARARRPQLHVPARPATP